MIRYALSAVSFLLLASGLLLSAFGTGWFASDTVRILWYMAAFIPVGVPVIREAVAEAVGKKDFFNEFTLMSVASVGAFCIGEYPEAVAVMLLYTVGEALQDRAVDRAVRNIGSLLDVRPDKASVLRDGKYLPVDPEDVMPEEEIEIIPGGRVPLDGILLEDEAVFDTSALTGESVPRIVRTGGEVLAGMIAIGEAVHLKVSRPYSQSELSRILRMVRDAAERKAPAELFIRKFARIYTPAVMLLALLITFVPALAACFRPDFTYVFADWLYRGLVFLVISCPCALVISVPLGYFGGIGAASRLGILFKGGNYIDAVARLRTVAFDKTGTLTKGSFGVTGVYCKGCGTSSLLPLMAAAESKSSHPAARAIVGYSASLGLPSYVAEAVHESAGHGVTAVVDGKEIAVGSMRFMAERSVKGLPAVDSDGISTVVFCAINGMYAGHLLLSDVLKDDACQAVSMLKEMHVGVCLLSGDKREIAEAFASRIGISNVYGGLLPEEKASKVEELKSATGSAVAFVGDGMNDAPVLAVSDVGIAMGGLGSDAAIESADIVIQTDQPSKVPVAISIGRATRAIVHQNIIGAIGIKAAIMVAGALGCASLWAAVFADVGVALLAVMNSVRIMFRKKF